MQEDMSFEEILEAVGSSGKYQKFLYLVFYLPMGFLIPWTILVPVLQGSVPDHWCHVPGKPPNVSFEAWKNRTIPWKITEGDWQREKCRQYVRLADEEANDNNTKLVGCQHGWDYDDTWYDATLATEANWVCSRDTYVARWLSVGVAGNIIGTLIFNSLSDIFGRKLIWLLTLLTSSVFSLVRLFVYDEVGILIVMFFSSFCFPANLEVTMILVLEQVSPSWRSHVAAGGFMTWTFGMSLLPMIAWLARDWIKLGIFTALPFFPFILCWRFVKESPRWLASRDRITEAIEALEYIAKMNGRSTPEGLEKSLKNQVDPKRPFKISEMGFLQLFVHPTLRKRTLLMTVCYLCNNSIYYGLIYNIQNMSGNNFLNFFLLSITELPANILGWAACQLIGRRATAVLFFFLSVLTVAIPILLPSSLTMVTNILLVSCKGLVNVSFLVVYIQFGELYPTSHRASGAGFSSIISAAFGVAAPFIAYSGKIWSRLPYMILGSLGVIGLVAALFLPETLGKPMPQTLLEGENHLVTQPFWSYLGKRPRWRKKREEIALKPKNNLPENHPSP